MSARKRFPAPFVLVLAALALLAPAAQADFGIETLSAVTRNEDKSVDLQAGSHPFEYELSITMNQDSGGTPEGTLRDLIAELPAGLIGNPMAVPRCTAADFEGAIPRCPGNTQIGEAEIKAAELSNPAVGIPVYNLTPPLGSPASFGFSAINLNSFQEASLRTGSDYGANVSDITIPTNVEFQYIKERIWGVPADESHDPARHCLDPKTGGVISGCPSSVAPAPFLTLPTSCAGPLVTTVRVDSQQEPGVFVPASAESLNEVGNPEGLSGCEGPPFSPTIAAQPDIDAADSPTGLHFNLHSHQVEDPSQLGTANLKDSVITLPAGLAVNPSAADGLGACSPAQIDLHGPGPAQCPASSKMGTVKVETPLLDHPVNGAIYLARQGENPFGSLIALYIAVDDPLTRIVVKLAGKVEPNPVTGRLVAIFKENPQLPFEDLSVSFNGGPRAALTTPPTCGTYTTTGDLTPWTTPEGADAFPSDPFTIGSAPGGGSCATSETLLPNAPNFEAGTASTLAGAFSPFVVKVGRANGSQRFAAINTTLPPGISAKLAGVTECSEAQIAQAKARSNPGEGALERASPACPASSEVGTVNVGAGSGSPFYVQGHVYLAGPYKGAPLSLAVITPAVAGPFDLGVVVVRAALYINEATAQATVKSDSIPQILQGIPLEVRSVAVKIDRPEFSLNPTNCEEMAVSGEEISTTGAVAQLKNRFQVGGCKGLDFSPKLSLQMKGAKKRNGHPALKAVLTQPPGQANTRRLVLIMPPTTFIDQNHIANPCTRAQFNTNSCPPASVLGRARVFTPLLDKPLEGQVYFRSNGGERELPDVVLDLHGQIHVVQVGFVDSVHKKGSESSRVRTTFAQVPDAPFSKAVVELRGGSKKGLLVNSANLCRVPNTATVKIGAQNNKAQDFDERIATGCSSK